jgi:phosphinothricin acetyltransferase
MTPVRIRPATAADAEGVRAIYAPIVASTTISFETVPPDAAEMARRIETANQNHAWLVAEGPPGVAGYAYGGPHRARAAYRFATEVSVYVHERHRGTGLGVRLYEELFTELSALGYYQAYAGITQPNEPSSRLHRRVGFSHVGTFPRVGYKFDAWHDVAWWHRTLRDGTPGRNPG